MYLEHYQLSLMPFGLTPNTSFYVNLTGHQQALEVLLTALQQGEGFIKVTGEVGTGKTLICRKLLNEDFPNWHIAYLPDPNLDPQQMRWALALELGLKQSGNIDQQQLAHLLQRQLLALAAQQKRVILLVDEAQALPDETLEALRLISNLETEQRKLIQIVLFGQPELNQRLAKHHLRQLRQRVSFTCEIPPLTSDEVRDYIDERLLIAGAKQPFFSRISLKLLAHYSRGIPRLINILAHKSLMLGYGLGKSRVGCRQVWMAARDTEDVKSLNFLWWLTPLIVGTGALLFEVVQ